MMSSPDLQNVHVLVVKTVEEGIAFLFIYLFTFTIDGSVVGVGLIKSFIFQYSF